MQTIEETRRSRLALLEVEAGSQTALAESIGKSPAQVSQWKNASVSTSGRERAMSSDIAREIEHKRGKPRGWMDQPTAPAPLEHVAEPSPPDYRAIRVPLLANGGSMGPGSEEMSTDVIVGALSLATDWVSRHVRPARRPRCVSFTPMATACSPH